MRCGYLYQQNYFWYMHTVSRWIIYGKYRRHDMYYMHCWLRVHHSRYHLMCIM